MTSNTDSPAAEVPVRAAVSVLLLRDGDAGPEVFVQHRVRTMDFAAGMVVYPGGRVDPVDILTAAQSDFPTGLVAEHERAWQKSTIAAEGLTGVGAPGQQDAGRAELAAAGELSEPSYAAVLIATAQRELTEETGAVIEAQALTPWANWTTPPGRNKRFDTYFFVADGRDMDVRHQTTEATDSGWMSTQEILAQRAEGTLRLMRPTLTLLMEIDAIGSAAGVLEQHRVVYPVRPTMPIDPSDAHRPLLSEDSQAEGSAPQDSTPEDTAPED